MIVEIGREQVELLPEKGVFWIKRKVLVVADLHLGKAAAFRNAGIPIPEGDMQRDLDRLQKIVEAKGAKHCIIVGDLLHHRTGMGEHTLEVIEKWMEGVPCDLDLVLGNHDRALKSVNHEKWKLNVHAQTLVIPPFIFSHHPIESEEGFVWSGHVHPQAHVKVGNKLHRFPCFQLGRKCAVLPAFSSFAGGCVVKEGEIYLIVNKEVIKLP